MTRWLTQPASKLSFWPRVAMLVALLVGLAPSAFAGEEPEPYHPNDPDYWSTWNLLSALPDGFRGSIDKTELALGPGIRADLAWQLHRGSDATVLAVLDSGIFWDSPDLIEQFYLNQAELPFPEGAHAHDANGDGRVSVADYAGDSRVRDANANGHRDPGDLIAAFSDGRDDDGNGFTDDIAGWDFYEGDNDPADRTRFGHGTMEAHDSAAAIDNGLLTTGVCGHCRVMPLRLDDSFIVDANSFQRAVVYAVDQGAAVVQQALGSVSHNGATQTALDYAYHHDVPVVGSAADENSFHHNYPATLDPALYPNAIRFDTADMLDATTFLNFNNCSNFGARVDVSVPALDCSSEATGILSGTVALTLSYARSLGVKMSAGMITALVRGTTSDINRGKVEAGATRHATYAGWDMRSGYGRLDAYRMLDAVRAKKLPPAARIVTPRWFDVVRKGASRELEVTIEARGASETAPLTVTLAVARGVETSGRRFRPLLTRELKGAFTGVLGQVPLEQMKGLRRSQRDLKAYENAYTLLLTVRDQETGLTSESRRTIFWFDDARLFASFPARLQGSGESGGVFFDLDGDGRDEFVTADGAGFVHAFHYPAGELTGFPATTEPSRYSLPREHPAYQPLFAGVVAPVAVGDVTGDGQAEIIVASLEGTVTAFSATGERLAGFPVAFAPADWRAIGPKNVTGRGIVAAPTLVDLDGEAGLEIVIASFDGQLHVLRGDGTSLAGFPVMLMAAGQPAKLASSPAVADLTGDGIADLIVGSNHKGPGGGQLFAVDGRGHAAPDGPLLKGFPARIPLIRAEVLPTIGVGIPASPVVADFDGDGELEIVIHGFASKAYLVSPRGELKRSLAMTVSSRPATHDTHMIAAFGSPAAADLDGDGQVDPVTVGAGRRVLVNLMLGGRRYDYDHMLTGWQGATGAMIEGFPVVTDDIMIMNSPAAADLTGDGRDELILGSGGYFVQAYSATGKVEGFPHFTGGWAMHAPSLGDFDGDGRFDVAQSTREGYVFIWRTEARRPDDGRPIWATFQGNAQRTGRR